MTPSGVLAARAVNQDHPGVDLFQKAGQRSEILDLASEEAGRNLSTRALQGSIPDPGSAFMFSRGDHS
jgi:hypothetical protein